MKYLYATAAVVVIGCGSVFLFEYIRVQKSLEASQAAQIQAKAARHKKRTQCILNAESESLGWTGAKRCLEKYGQDGLELK